MARKRHRSEPHANQPAHRASHCFEEPPHFAIAALAKNDVEPSVGAIPSRRPQRLETRFAIAQDNARRQRGERVGTRGAVYSNRVLAFDSRARMHEPVRKFAVVGKQQQSGGVEVKSPDGDPSSPAERGKPVENRRSPERVTAGRHLSGRLVVADEPAPGGGSPHDLPIHTQDIVGRCPIPEGCGTPVDADPARGDPALGLAPRGQTGVRQDLLELFGRFDFRRRARPTCPRRPSQTAGPPPPVSGPGSRPVEPSVADVSAEGVSPTPFAVVMPSADAPMAVPMADGCDSSTPSTTASSP